jgi:hypothetical protein
MAWARGITAIKDDDGRLKGSIAGVDRETGIMYLNRSMIDSMRLPKDVVFFIMLHEMGHLVLQTSDEVKVDQWAHDEYLKRGYSLKQSVFALTKILRFNSQEDFIRAKAQLARAQHFDTK